MQSKILGFRAMNNNNNNDNNDSNNNNNNNNVQIHLQNYSDNRNLTEPVVLEETKYEEDTPNHIASNSFIENPQDSKSFINWKKEVLVC